MADSVYSLEQIEGWQAQLKDFAKTPRTRFSKKQAVEALIDEIESALEAHPFDEVAEQLKEWGLDIAAGSLKQYVNAYRREQADENPTPARKRSGKKSKQKSPANNASKRSSVTANKTDTADSEMATSNSSPEHGASSRTSNSNRTPDGFLEMPEEL